MEKVTVLWLSRHKPLPSQIAYLKQKLGDFNLVQHSQPISTADQAVQLIKKHNAQYVVPVLPLSFIAHLVTASAREGFTVLRAEMENIHNCSPYTGYPNSCPDYNPDTDTIMQSKDFSTGETIYRHFRFREFRKLKAIEIVTEPW